MHQIIRAQDRSFRDHGWLKTYWLFSFGDYYDPKNMNHGMLRVFNDDVVAAGTGFPTHPHDEMEIVSVVLSGEMTHRDSMGNVHLIRENEVQVMSAGTGITHSEMNESDRPVHFFQIWFPPTTRGLTPSYGQKEFDPAQWTENIVPLASGMAIPGALPIHTDAAVYRGGLKAGGAASLSLGASRQLFVYVFAGAISVNGYDLDTHDQARLSAVSECAIEAREDAEFIIIHTR